MPAGSDVSRSTLAYEVARRLIYLSAPDFPEVSVVRVSKSTLDKLLGARQMPESEHRQLLYLLNSLDGCDLDRCERVDDLVQEIASTLTLWPEAFPDGELMRLRGLL